MKHFYLQVDNIHKIYVEETGKGIPIICLHGGPGFPVKTEHYTKLINPKKYRIINFHQRGCGKSTPYGCLKRNKTKYLVQDIEKIRKHLKIDKWVVYGGSWGAYLAVYYSLCYPKRVLLYVSLGFPKLGEMFEESTCVMAPDVYDKWKINGSEKSSLKLYFKKLQSKNRKEKQKYVKKWNYEMELFKIMNFEIAKEFKTKKKKNTKELQKNLTSMALLECYYYMNKGFLPKNFLLKNASKIKKVPGYFVHGRYDLICSPKNSYEIHKKLPKSKLIITELAGHSFVDKNNFIALKKIFKEYKIKRVK